MDGLKKGLYSIMDYQKLDSTKGQKFWELQYYISYGDQYILFLLMEWYWNNLTEMF